MINNVKIEGEVVNGSWGKSEEAGYFLIIKQTRKVSKFTWVNYFSLYANKPLAEKIAEIVEKNPHAHILVEGTLRTYHSKKTGEWKTTILIQKILDSNTVKESILPAE